MSVREYSRRRGCTMQAVRKAIEAGRLSKCLVHDHRGKPKIADPELADREWEANTRHDKLPPALAAKRARRNRKPAPELPPAQPVAPEKQPQSESHEEPVEEPLSDDATFSDANRRLQLAKARKAELDLAERRGELVRADDVRQAWATIVALTRTKMLSLPSKAKQHLPQLTVTDIGTLETLVREGLEDLCQASALPN